MAENTNDPLPSPLDAVTDIRATAKWTIAAAGAVGAALISGAPLAAAGHIHGVAHAVAAGIGLLIALGGVGLAIWATTDVLAPRLTTPATLRALTSPATLTSPKFAILREIVESEPSYFFGTIATSIDDLLRHQQIKAALARQLLAEPDPKRCEMITKHLQQAARNAESAAPYVRWMLEVTHVCQVQDDLRRSRRYTMIGAALVVLGAVLFFSVTGSH